VHSGSKAFFAEFCVSPCVPRLLVHVLHALLCLTAFYYNPVEIHAQTQVSDVALSVAVRVNGIPARFLLDTGADRSVLDKEFAQRLGLHSGQIMDVQRAFLTETDEVIHVRDLNLGSVSSENLEMITSDLAASTRAVGFRVDGVIGVDVLRRFSVKLRLSSGEVTFQQKAGHANRSLLVRLHNVGGRYFVPLRIQDVPLELLLDTGTNLSVLSPNAWTRLSSKWTPTSIIEGIRSAGGSVETKLFCAPEVTLKGKGYRNIPMRISPATSEGFFADPAFQGLLGSEFLERFVILLDLSNDTMELSEDPQYEPDPSRFSTIGIQYTRGPAGQFTIIAVWSPSPAATAGLKAGDQILSVNGLSTKDIGFEALSQQIHGIAGRDVRLVLISGGVEIHVSIKIADLICQGRL
jgi:predicted aspartyl protease